jgi:hypothetical protein
MSQLILEQKHSGFSGDAQLMNYLRASGLRVGLLINFSHYPGVEHERFVI